LEDRIIDDRIHKLAISPFTGFQRGRRIAHFVIMPMVDAICLVVRHQ
jgi:hypothetical protein